MSFVGTRMEEYRVWEGSFRGSAEEVKARLAAVGITARIVPGEADKPDVVVPSADRRLAIRIANDYLAEQHGG